jgi:hypothetical protein
MEKNKIYISDKLLSEVADEEINEGDEVELTINLPDKVLKTRGFVIKTEKEGDI